MSKPITTWTQRLWFEKEDSFRNVRLLLWGDGSVTWEIV